MVGFVESLTVLQTTFFITAGIGSVLFLIRLVLLFIGLGDDGDAVDVDSMDGDIADGDGDADFDSGDGDSVDGDSPHDSSDVSFSLLSFQGLTAFFMMFGWVGLAMSKGSGYGMGLSLGAGIAAGLATVWVIKQLFKFFSSMQNSGTMNLKNAVGEEGTVYLTIKENKAGKVRITVHGHLKVMEAVSRDGTKIPTDSRIEVVEVRNGNVLVVTKK